jgi:predicted metal-binding protein
MKCDQHELAAQLEPNCGRSVSIAVIEIDGISTLLGDVVPDDEQIEARFTIEIE